MRIIKQELDKFSIDKLSPYAQGDMYFPIYPGEHYRLLSYLSSQLEDNSLILDLGTFRGLSALALSYNEKCKVVTFDIKDVRIPFITNIPNIEFIFGDWKNCLPYLNQAKLILLDIGHDGPEEKEFMDLLTKSEFSGILIVDDIQIYDSMKEFWGSIELEKYDFTHLGHSSGTGVIPINTNLEV